MASPARLPGTAPLSYKKQMMTVLSTGRLILRRWRESDREPFAKINSDPRVMEFLPKILSREESDLFIDRIEAHFKQHKFGLFAAELRADHSFIGYIGLSVPSFVAACTPCVEIGWRISGDRWGRGLATEGALEVLGFAFGDLRLESLVSFAVPANVRSLRVMEKIGMNRDPDGDFEHPNLPKGHPLSGHLLYRMGRLDWTNR